MTTEAIKISAIEKPRRIARRRFGPGLRWSLVVTTLLQLADRLSDANAFAEGTRLNIEFAIRNG
jgi:hypothetical protein